jgi:hypothetical protein
MTLSIRFECQCAECRYAECRYAECTTFNCVERHYAECRYAGCAIFIMIMLNFIMLSDVMLGVPFLNCYAERHYAECRYAECHGAFISAKIRPKI